MGFRSIVIQRVPASRMRHNQAHQPRRALEPPRSRASCQHPEAQDERGRRAERDWGLYLEQWNTVEDQGW